MMVLAVTLHNIPEGMAAGVVYAGYLAGTAQITDVYKRQRLNSTTGNTKITYRYLYSGADCPRPKKKSV